MAYFDRPENSSSAISVRLSSDAAAFEQMLGARCGALCEAIAMSLIGFLFGVFFSWELTLIVVGSFIIMCLIGYLYVNLDKNLNNQSRIMLDKSNTVGLSSDILHSHFHLW